ncbi:flagellar motor switch protein FliN [bacterium]|nr:flagellar motor switch protein FliN [bacterium]PIV80581.1 MAG: flagellar motor switch protein FliN [bacterium CG17_big_fil_post_rev_8_21_14_2_50_64_8]PJA75306.1 MAG: flagellar motor switch protein FliN [bacterium CG_4_9_14_3_um_filter_65_15]
MSDDTTVLEQDAPGVSIAAGGSLDEESQSLIEDLGNGMQGVGNLDLLLDVNLKISVELGRTRLKFRDVLNLSAGSVVELGRQTSEPVDIMVNGALLATGEVVVVDDHFAVRITKLLNRVERLKRVL